ncbi:MAG: glycosyltransferase [Gammaproteobacteria bacterium]|nr:glycosyltransferase [Gammaproteobacteria bacterium]
MHILMISDVYFPRVNGVSTSIHTFIAEHKKLGNKVTLVCPDYSNHKNIYYDIENDIIRLPSKHIMFDPEDRLIKLSSFDLLKEKLAEFQFDIIHIQTPFIAHHFGTKLSHLLGIPCVETYHTFFEEYFHHYIPFIPKSVLRFFSKRLSAKQCNELDAVIVPSSAMRDVLYNYGVNAPLNIIPTGLQLSNFEAGDGRIFRSKHTIPESRPVLLYVGRVAREKNIDFLIDMLTLVKKQISDVLLVIAGEGPAQKSLQKLAVKHGLQGNTLFIGYMKRDSELLDCYRSANAFVFSSNTETQGLVLLEALACGTPVVSTAVMGTIDVLNPVDGGCIIAEQNHRDFSAKVVELLKDTSLQNKLRHQAGKYIQEWSAVKFAQKTTVFYRSVINENDEILERKSSLFTIDQT